MTSDRERWQRIRSLFDALVEEEEGARRARLEEIGREDPLLRDEVERLLVADRGSDGALRDYDFALSHDPPADDAPSRDPLGVIGCTVSHFRVTAYLAAGGMGVVYRAEDLQLGRVVALKFPLPHQEIGRGVKERFVNEARSAAALDHPNLCTVHEIGESEHGVFLAMPLYPGETLRERLAREGTLSPEVAIDIVTQLATGLASAHAAGIVHRDLKGGNVMLLPDGTVKVLDFGLAKIRDVDLTKSRTTLGTIGYVAPEQIRGRRVDERTDLWAIGVMLYEALTGVRPFVGDHELAVLHAVLEDEPRPPSALNASLTPAFDQLIGTLLQKDPDDRYQSADALLVDLAALRNGAPLAHRGDPARRRAARRRRTRAVLLAGGGVALLAAAGAGWEVSRRRAAAQSSGSSAASGAPVLTWTGDTTVVATGAELAAALVPENAGRHVRVRAGTYDVDRPLVVPDGMTLEGAGVMQFGDDGLPAGFGDDTRSTIRMTANVGGDVLTLGHGTTVGHLEIVDLAGRSGNVVSVASRRARDSVSVALVETVIVNPNQYTIGPGGALGRGIHVVTPNHNLGADPAPHEGATLDVRLVRSVIRSPVGGGGLFAFNFASGGRISLDVERSVIGGTNEANGGVSRPDEVHGAEVRIASRGNLYRNEWADPCTPAVLGWNLTGGSGAPVPIELPATTRNRLLFHSEDDRIERFRTGVHATASRRFFPEPLNAAPSHNRIDLLLVGTTIATPPCRAAERSADRLENSMGVALVRVEDAADLRLVAASAEGGGFDAGSHNVIRAELRGVTGSGTRGNVFSSARGPSGDLPARLRGDGNRLEIVGDLQAFVRQNRGIDPSPAAGFFLGERGRQTAAAAAASAREPIEGTIPRDRAVPQRRVP